MKEPGKEPESTEKAMESEGGFSRRAFLSGAAIGAASLAAAGLAACTPAAESGGGDGSGGEAPASNKPLDTAKYPALADSRNPIDWLGTPPDVTPEDCTETIEADVVVIGTAVAGELAGYGAVKEGAKVVLLERNGTA
ncbi:MAG: hypothetical protein LBS98_06000, partial [Coriobacteriales bacterium]|nr:hypothetical protein [Coriobacteriales bacterium]